MSAPSHVDNLALFRDDVVGSNARAGSDADVETMLYAHFNGTSRAVHRGRQSRVHRRRAREVVASPSAGHAPDGGQFPVTGSHVWVLSGVGLALIVAGTVLFMAYRRRRNLKVVA